MSLCACTGEGTRYLAAPERIAAAGDYVHPPSGTAFPRTVAGFDRVDIAHFEQADPDIAVTYDRSGPAGSIAAMVHVHSSPSLLTVGLSPDAVGDARERACALAFKQRLDDIRRYSVARLIEQRAVTLRQGEQRRAGRLAILSYTTTFAGRRQPVRTEFASFCYGRDDWTLEFRFTYPEEMDAQDWVSAFMRGFRWTGKPNA